MIISGLVLEVTIKDIAHIGTTGNLKRYVYDRVGNSYFEPLENLDGFSDFTLALKTLL